MENGPVRLHSLDALRGIASLAVVCLHWQHLQLLATPNETTTWPPISGSVDHTLQPLHVLLWPFYARGYVAVDAFFLISGFIFFWLYRDKLASRTMSISEFSFLRFSRLYPLHFALLLVVASLQICFVGLTGQPFIYPANDWPHFLMSLLFIQGTLANAAFNGPEWSLTIEIIMYAAFCVLARFGLLRRIAGPAAVFVIGVIVSKLHYDLSRGICGFFAGGITYIAFTTIRRVPYVRKLIFALLFATSLGWAVVIADLYESGAISMELAKLLPTAKQTILIYSVLYGLFPMTILLFALHENVFGARYNSIAWLGEISYSSYLLHFPLQLVLANSVAYGIVDKETARSGPCMLLYFCVLIPLSIVVFRKFERPMQNALRRQWQRHISSHRKPLRV
ncbi:MAG TPA: acyltransferase [Steroidobacteraceae bacterium]|jgi:peptidoglycan/LPS O-acetylase OafA/YrhL|nr:acyltransferase [Steroidobacteraceae bacterium]